jgi:hypothetical protein
MRPAHETMRPAHVILGELKTQKKKIDYVREILKEIGICKSVKSVSQNYYDTIYDIVQHHPRAHRKLLNAVDFYIKTNVRSGTGLALCIRKRDGTVEDVSWVCCATGKGRSPRESFCRALRVCIDDQIKDFRVHADTDTSRCAMCCKSVETYHVDHVITFKKLVDKFIAMYPQPFKYPTKFVNCKDGTNQYRLADTVMEKAFQRLHKDEAVLRITCEKCNMSRAQ